MTILFETTKVEMCDIAVPHGDYGRFRICPFTNTTLATTVRALSDGLARAEAGHRILVNARFPGNSFREEARRALAEFPGDLVLVMGST
jgi:hypothetical protein